MIATNCDKDGNNMLHLVGEFSQLNIVLGAALHMQLELLWFEEIKKIVPLAYLKAENSKGKTPKDVFTETHQGLHKDGEKWMRDTANHCMVVATLIATVVFATAFTIPGGNNQGNGTPIFLDHTWFMVFFLSDSIAMLSASTSILIFLSILTSRYTEKDFLDSLPTRLLFGLLALFISIVGMVVAFGATCFLLDILA
ncbi:ankyrin repeat-containing protein NPR4-like [Corylus avellana]|uniref:ankyrin repeat-containing protein NPR4-like n=1 Tax=Corylus avellana TaxID=13451 RepID=UPI00286A1267|nr:ankyrin repeat-containing protein NPR4-like [Corylus avellana]